MVVVVVVIAILKLVLLLLLAAVASAAARGGAIPLLACAETRVLALCSPAIELCFCFRIGFAVFYSKKVLLSSAFHIVFFGVFLCLSHVASVFTVFLPTLDFLHMPAWTCICLSALCRGWGGADVHANANFVFCFLCSPCSGLFWCGTLVGRGGGGGGGEGWGVLFLVFTLFWSILVRYIGGEGGGGADWGGVMTSMRMRPCLPFLVASLWKRPRCKSLEFLKLSRQKLRN